MSVVPFDPSDAQAARWRDCLAAALGDRGIPPDAALEMELRPHGEGASARLILDLDWAASDAGRHAHVEVLIPLRRALGEGWSGWPAYLLGVKLLRALG
jgi:hypothetical protein